jgi:hypothetical protein
VQSILWQALIGLWFLACGPAMDTENILSSCLGELGMKSGADIDERRGEQRFPFKVTIVLQELSPTRKTPLPKTAVPGVIQNLSNNGFSISTAVPLTYATVVRCDIAIKNLSVSIPTMAQVRWVQRAHAGEYRSGLTYLL